MAANDQAGGLDPECASLARGCRSTPLKIRNQNVSGKKEDRRFFHYELAMVASHYETQHVLSSDTYILVGDITNTRADYLQMKFTDDVVQQHNDTLNMIRTAVCKLSDKDIVQRHHSPMRACDKKS